VNHGAIWREDINSLAFRTERGMGLCMVHRLAFRTLMRADVTPEGCVAFFERHRPAFDRAACRKVEGEGIPRGANFHLTSRDIRRALRDVSEGVPTAP
jgi:hypothetical protein